MRKNFFTTNYLFIFISIVFVAIVASLYFQSHEAIKKSRNEIYKIEIHHASPLSIRISKEIDKETSGNISSLFKNPILRAKLNKLLSLYVNAEFKYIYLIYTDKNGAYRYLLDGSSGLEKAAFKQKFDPLLLDLWNKALKTKKPTYTLKQSAQGLWITYLYPIIKNAKVEAILSLDISTQEYLKFNEVLSPFDRFLKVLLFISIIIIFTLFILGYLFYRLRKQSMLDPLTKLYNRNYLNNISTKINLSQTAIMMLDIDYFKKVNDLYGHDVGDIVLSFIAKKLLIATRLNDRIIRYGGEEFLVIIEHPKDKYEVMQIAQRINESVFKDAIRVNEKMSIHVAISIGVNPQPNKNQSLKEAIKIADEMLYLAKNNGRNRIEVYEGI